MIVSSTPFMEMASSSETPVDGYHFTSQEASLHKLHRVPSFRPLALYMKDNVKLQKIFT